MENSESMNYDLSIEKWIHYDIMTGPIECMITLLTLCVTCQYIRHISKQQIGIIQQQQQQKIDENGP